MPKTLAAIALAMMVFSSVADVTVTKDLLEQDAEDIPGASSWEDTIEIHKDVLTNARIEVTSKGNGTLEVLNLSLRIYDSHDDTGVYKDQMLLIEFTDLNEDGYLDLMVTGIYHVTPEQRDGVLEEHVVVFMCHFEPKTNQFKKIYQQMPVGLEDRFKEN
jgi:predicted enzyme involved in methoxymalonyl-ACP biosynthesis